MEGPPQSLADLAREYDEVSHLLEHATQDDRRAYNTVILQGMTAELNERMPAGSSILVTNAANSFTNSGGAFNSSANGGDGDTTENAFE
jgi:hypothetical protein